MDDRRQEADPSDRTGQSTMDDSRYGEEQRHGSQDRSGRSGQGPWSQRQAQGGGMTAQDRETRSTGGSSSDWEGYVVPYQYYGPGYRGVGYYAVVYQGPGGEGGRGRSQGLERLVARRLTVRTRPIPPINRANGTSRDKPVGNLTRPGARSRGRDPRGTSVRTNGSRRTSATASPRPIGSMPRTSRSKCATARSRSLAPCPVAR